MIKYFLLVLLVVSVMFFGACSALVFAQIEVNSLGSVVSLSGWNEAIGVEGYPDSIYQWCSSQWGDAYSGCNCTNGTCSGEHLIYSGTSTVLAYSLTYPDQLFEPVGVGLQCDGVPSGLYYELGGVLIYSPSPTSFSSSVQLHCAGDLSFVDYGGLMTAHIQYVPYDTRLVDSSNNKDVEFGLAIIIVLICIAFVAFFFNKIKAKKPWLHY